MPNTDDSRNPYPRLHTFFVPCFCSLYFSTANRMPAAFSPSCAVPVSRKQCCPANKVSNSARKIKRPTNKIFHSTRWVKNFTRWAHRFIIWMENFIRQINRFIIWINHFTNRIRRFTRKIYHPTDRIYHLTGGKSGGLRVDFFFTARRRRAPPFPVKTKHPAKRNSGVFCVFSRIANGLPCAASPPAPISPRPPSSPSYKSAVFFRRFRRGGCGFRR